MYITVICYLSLKPCKSFVFLYHYDRVDSIFSYLGFIFPKHESYQDLKRVSAQRISPPSFYLLRLYSSTGKYRDALGLSLFLLSAIAVLQLFFARVECASVGEAPNHIPIPVFSGDHKGPSILPFCSYSGSPGVRHICLA